MLCLRIHAQIADAVLANYLRASVGRGEQEAVDGRGRAEEGVEA